MYESVWNHGRFLVTWTTLEDQETHDYKSSKGQAIVEFVVVLPILLLLMLGLINLGMLINAQIILTQAAWEGARVGTTLDPSMGEGDAEIAGAVQTALTGLTNPASVGIDIEPDEPARSLMSWPKPRGEPLTIRLVYSLNIAVPMLVTVNLGAEATSRIEYSN